MYSPKPSTSKSNYKNKSISSPQDDIIETSDVEADSSLFIKKSQKSQKQKRSNLDKTKLRNKVLKRTLDNPSTSTPKKIKPTFFDDSLFFNEMVMNTTFSTNDTNKSMKHVNKREISMQNKSKNNTNSDRKVKKIDENISKNADKDDELLSISQLNEFVVNDSCSDLISRKVVSQAEGDEFQFTQYCNNSQFMSQIETAIAKIKEINKSQSLKNITNVSNMPRSLKTKADSFNTTFNDALWELFKSSQYKREIEKSFDKVEQSICYLGNNDPEDEFNLSLNKSTTQRKQKIEEILEKTFKSPEVMKKILKHTNDSVNLNNEQIEWPDETFLTNATKNTSSVGNLLKNAFIENVNKSLLDGKLQQDGSSSETKFEEEFMYQGNFFGLPDRVKDLFKVYKGIDTLYEWQKECLNLPAIKKRKNLIYALPTSGGKTLVAEVLILREILCRRKNAIFVLPYVAIVQEKVWAMSPFAVALDFLLEEYAAGKGNYPPRQRRRKHSVYICTIEKALGLMNSLIEAERTQEIGLIVVDELHLLGDGSRGTCLENLVTKTKLLKHHVQIVGMSATIGNLNDLCQFLNAEVYCNDFRPVELNEYVKCQNEIAKVNKNDNEDILTYEKTVNYYKTANNLNKIDPDQLGGLVMEVIPDASCLIFCKTRQNCENVANLLCKVIHHGLKKHRDIEKQHLKKALKDEIGTICSVLKNTLDYGIAYHHSGLTSEERRLIEEGFRQGVISVICCTSTLAAGVNLPAKRVIIRNPYVGREFINLSRYKQMIGRAGRAGYGEIGESILICTPQELPRVRDILQSPMDIALSSMHENKCDGLQNFLLSCVSLKLASTKVELQNLVGKTLLAVQATRLDVNLRSLTRQAIKHLFRLGALKTGNMNEDCALENSISVDLENTLKDSTQQSVNATDESGKKPKLRIDIQNDTPLEISRLGSAAIKGGLDLTRAHILYEDLLKAQSSLVLFTGLHLMYLVTPYTISEQVNPSKSLYYSLYNKLNFKEMQTAKVLGLTEAVAGKLLTNRKITEITERVLNRFYVTLMLYDLWNEISVYEVSLKYDVNRGLIQNLMTSAASFASNVYHFCGEFEEFWAFSLLLKGMSDRLSHCCVKELIPLMKLPSVKQNRAKQLFNAGYKTLQSVARADPQNLMHQVDYMSRQLANQLIAAAKMILLEKVENLREEAEDVLEGVNFSI